MNYQEPGKGETALHILLKISIITIEFSKEAQRSDRPPMRVWLIKVSKGFYPVSRISFLTKSFDIYALTTGMNRKGKCKT